MQTLGMEHGWRGHQWHGWKQILRVGAVDDETDVSLMALSARAFR